MTLIKHHFFVSMIKQHIYGLLFSKDFLFFLVHKNINCRQSLVLYYVHQDFLFQPLTNYNTFLLNLPAYNLSLLLSWIFYLFIESIGLSFPTYSNFYHCHDLLIGIFVCQLNCTYNIISISCYITPILSGLHIDISYVEQE